MRSRVVPQKKDYERIYQHCWEEVMDVIVENNAITLIAAIRHFGLGAKRTQRFLAFLDEIRSEFEGYQNDEILHKKIDAELLEVGIDSSEMWNEQESFADKAEKMRKSKKNIDLTIHEARDIKAKLEGFRKVVKS